MPALPIGGSATILQVDRFGVDHNAIRADSGTGILLDEHLSGGYAENFDGADIITRKAEEHTARPADRGIMNRTLSYFAAFIGSLCVYFIIHLFFSTHVRTVRSDVIQGFLIGYGLAFASAQAYARIKAVKVNGWVTMFGLGKPGNGMFLRAAHAQLFPGPVNVPEEAMYWWTNADGAGRTLIGRHDYVMHFPAGQLPPNDAFWSLTMATARNRFVPNLIKRYSVSDRSGLLPNADGSIDIYIRNAARADHGTNWLPAPSGKFLLWLRVYQPGQAILNGEYTVPPVVKVKMP
jgi:hypothetical protein